MLKSIWTWWNTPMVPMSDLIDLRREYVDLMTENERLEWQAADHDGMRRDAVIDLDEAMAERDAAQLERDKAVGKFEYVDARNKDLEKTLADRNAYIKFLEDSLRQYQPDDDDMDDDFDDIDDLCDDCGQEIEDCDCDDDCEDDEDTCPCCGQDM